MSRRVVLVVAGAAGLAVAAQWAPALVRVPAGLLLALVLPGLALTAVLFGTRRLSTVERLVLPPALSAAVLVLGGLALFAAGVPLGRVSWTALTAGVTVLASAGTLLQRRRQSVTETAMFGTVLVAERERMTARSAFWRLVPLALAVLLVAGAAALAVRSTAAGHEPFTALSLVPAGDRPAVVVTVHCEEDGPVGYSLRVQGANGYQQTFVVTLQPGSTWSRTLDVPRTGTVTADLFKGTTAVPYRTVHLAGGR
jgi:uncharacterized membrane protein